MTSFSNVSNTLNQINNNTNQIQYEQGRKNVGSSKLGKDAFLQLMLAQLRNQDPTNPISDKEFISQQAQFTQVEKLDEINANLQQANRLTQAGSLVGRQVKAKLEDGSQVTGQVTSAEVTAEGVKYQVGGKTVSTEQIIGLYSDSPATL